MTAQDIITQLQMLPHPEGGYYKETYRSGETISVHGNERNVSTAIYFLLENKNKSHFHRIQSDELWFFHQGEPLEILSIQNGELVSTILGNNIVKGELPQAIIPANTWFASHVKDETGYALVSCTVAPGFDFADFELAERNDLIAQYPQLKQIIEEFTMGV
jgi:uncharacterized protein